MQTRPVLAVSSSPDGTTYKSSSIVTQARFQSRSTLRPLTASCKISPVMAAVLAQSMFHQAQAGAQTCLDPTSNWMALREVAASPAMRTNSLSTDGERSQDHYYGDYAGSNVSWVPPHVTLAEAALNQGY